LIIDGGQLITKGQAADPVIFSSASTLANSGDWKGIKVKSGDIQLDYSVIEFAQDGLEINIGTPVLDHLTLRNNSNNGLVLNSGGALTNMKIEKNKRGVLANGSSPITIDNSLITLNSGNVYTIEAEVLFGGYDPGGQGIEVTGDSSIKVNESTITDNTFVGLQAGFFSDSSGTSGSLGTDIAIS
jgi:hypothetical protein